MSEAGPPPAAAVATPEAVAPVIKSPRIEAFTLCDFRAFAGPEPVTFNLDGKNLLIYGENGAGKSSVFHALDEFFSVAHRGPQARKERLLGLKNVFSGQPDTAVKISVEFDDGKPAVEWTTARHPVDIAPAADDRVKNAAYRKAILDYRSLLETNYRHGNGPVNLFDVCINVLLRDFEVIHDGRQHRLFDLWLDVQGILDVEGRGRLRLGKGDAAAVRKILPSINQGLREALSAILPEIGPMLKCLGWEDIEIVSLTVPGLTYTDKSTIPAKDRIETRRVEVELKFRGHSVDRPHLFLNEARLSALALAIYLAGRKICAGPPQRDTPRLIVLDDVLIGLDQSNRLPVIDVLTEQFKDWQIILLTHDRVWFEMARTYLRQHRVDNRWRYTKIHSGDDPTHAPVISPATSSAAKDVISDGRKFLSQGHINAAGNYARIAVELALREFCEDNRILIRYRQMPDKTPAKELLTAVQNFSSNNKGLYKTPLSLIEMYTSILFNKLSHGGVHDVSSHEVQGALNAVDGLLFALNVVPTGTKAPVP